jgi:hypothetical protein
VAIADAGRDGQARFLGEIPSSPQALHRLVLRLKGRHRRLSFCYEAGPCGYGVHRLLSGLGQDCSVVAPSLIPSRPGDRVKTNRDATTLANVRVGGRGMGGIAALLAVEVALAVAPAAARRRLVLARVPGPEALQARPGLDQAAVDREVLVGQQRLDLGLAQHRCQRS